MTQEEIYELLHQVLEPFNRGLDLDRRTALDGLLDVASRKLAAKQEVSIETKTATGPGWLLSDNHGLCRV